MINYVDVKIDNDIDYYLKIPALSPQQTMSAIESAHRTIDYITKNYPPPYTLCLSGGVDSQAMLYAWHTSGHKFNTFSAIYNFDLNSFDLEQLREFSEKYKIYINFVNFDLISFLFDEYEHYANTYRCGSPHICTYMKFVDSIKDGTVILSGQIRLENVSSAFKIDKNNFGMYKFGHISKKSVVPWFFMETYDMFNNVSCLKYPETEDSNLLYHYKCQTYLTNDFFVIPQKNKFTGFEKIKDYFDENYSHLVKKQDLLYRTTVQRSLRTFDVLFRNKYELKFSRDKLVYKYT